MRDDVFSAALRATARVAFSVAFVAGCTTTHGTDAPASDASEVKAAKPPSDEAKTDGPSATKPDASLYDKPDAQPNTTPDAASSCEDRLVAFEAEKDEFFAAWTDAGTQPMALVVSTETKACCAAELSVEDGWMSKYRDACCRFAFAWGTDIEPGPDAQAIQSACTPWGPPVPPAMKANLQVMA